MAFLKNRCRFTLMLAMVVCIASISFAQTNTASITGQALDPAKKPVANASVLIINTDLNAKRTVLTDATGNYRAAGLAPGAYTVEATAPNLKTRRPGRATLGLGSSVRIDLALAIPAVRQGTTVTAGGRTSEGNTIAPPVNKEEASVSNFFTGNTVTYLPNRDRDYTQFGQLAAGVAEDPSENGLAIAGQRSNAVVTQVDGVSFNDPLHGGRRGAGDGAFLLPQTTVREFQIVRSGVTSEVGGTNAGLINVATKEGSNKLRAEAFYTVRPTWATSADAFGHPLDNQQNTFGFSFGNALKKDKIFYYLGFEQDILQAPYYTQFAPQAAGVALPTNLFGLQGQVAQRNTPTAISLRGDDTLSARNSLNLQLMFNRASASNVASSDFAGSSRSLATMDHTDALSGHSVWSKAALTTLLNERTVNQAVFAYSVDHRHSTPNSLAPEIDINGVGTVGGDALGQHLYTSQQHQILDTVTLTRGSRSLALGGAFDISPAYEQQEANLNGRFDYNSLAAYVANTPRRFQQTFATGNTKYQGTLKSTGFFADAKLPLGKRATLTAGLRWDGQFNPQPQLYNAALLQTRSIPNDLGQFQPRAGIAWTPYAHTTIRVSTGLYTAATPSTLFHRVSSDNGTQTIVLDTYFDPQLLPAAAASQRAFAAPPVGLLNPQALVFGIAPNFRNPRSLQAAGTIEQEVHTGYTVSAGYLHASTWRLERRLDLNLAPPNTLGIFAAPRPNASIGRLLTEESDGHSDYNGLLLSSSNQIGRRSSLNINYTLSQTHDDDTNNGPFSIDSALSPYNLKAERAYSSLDVRSVLNVSAIFNGPYGLKLNPLLLARSGRPYTPLIGFDTQGDANDFNDRAVINGVTATRNSMRQPAMADIDLRLVKDFTLKGTGHHLDLFMDVFNLTGFNNRNFGPQSVSFFGNAASPVASQGQALYAPDGTRIGGPREIQFTARLVAF